MEKLIQYVKDNHIKTPVKLEIGLDKLTNKNDRNGNQVRYLHVELGGKDVSELVANAASLNVSKANDTKGDVIIHGCGMDMGFALQYRIYKCASAYGESDMFDDGDYKYIGKKSDRIYPYRD